jgi:hypothetical protein
MIDRHEITTRLSKQVRNPHQRYCPRCSQGHQKICSLLKIADIVSAGLTARER